MPSRLFKGFLIIFLIGLTIYSFSLPNSFIWDEIHLIQENHFIKNLDNLPLAFTRFLFHDVQGKSKFYRPIQEISYALDYHLWGLNPFGFHLTNSLLHIGCALLFSLLLYQIFKNPFISFWGGAFFVAHPVHTEAVAYIAGRADSLALLFILLSLSCYIRALKGKSIFLIVSLFSFLLALFSRESSLIFPLVILAYNFVFSKEKNVNPVRDFRSLTVCADGVKIGGFLPAGRQVSNGVKRKLMPFFLFMIIDGIYLFIRFKFLTAEGFKLYAWTQPWAVRLLTVPKVAIRYFLLLLFPHNLHMERFVPWSRNILDFSVISSLIFILVIVYLCIKLSKQEKNLIFFFLFFVITLFPFLNIIPLNAQLAEHWLYLPSIGFFAVFAWGACRVENWLILSSIKRRLNLGEDFLPLILTLVLCIYSGITIKQIQIWQDPLTFFKYTTQKAPYSNRARLGLGSAYLKEKRYYEAAGLFRIITKNYPDNLKARNNLASALSELGEFDKAGGELEIVLRMNPEYIQGYLQLANLYKKKDEQEKAIETYQKMMTLAPDNIYSYYELGNLYYKSGQFEKAIDVFKKGIAINDKFTELHNNLGICYAELDRLDEAEIEWRKALSLDLHYQEAKYNLEKLKREH